MAWNFVLDLIRWWLVLHMPSIRYYFYRRWSTCRKVRAWLLQCDVKIEERDFFNQRFSKFELLDLFGQRPISEFFSWTSPSFRKLDLGRDELDDHQLVELMLSEPKLIRRPLIVLNNTLLEPSSSVDRVISVLTEKLRPLELWFLSSSTESTFIGWILYLQMWHALVFSSQCCVDRWSVTNVI